MLADMLGKFTNQALVVRSLGVTLQGRLVQEEWGNAERRLSMAYNLVQVVYIALPQRLPIHCKYEIQTLQLKQKNSLCSKLIIAVLSYVPGISALNPSCL